MKLSEIKNEQALDMLAELLVPVTEILADKEIKKKWKLGAKKNEIASIAIKKHKTEVLNVLAILDGVPIDEYECNILTLPVKVLEILNDKDLTSFFASAVQMKDEGLSGDVTESTQEEDK